MPAQRALPAQRASPEPPVKTRKENAPPAAAPAEAAFGAYDVSTLVEWVQLEPDLSKVRIALAAIASHATDEAEARRNDVASELERVISALVEMLGVGLDELPNRERPSGVLPVAPQHTDRLPPPWLPRKEEKEVQLRRSRTSHQRNSKSLARELVQAVSVDSGRESSTDVACPMLRHVVLALGATAARERSARRLVEGGGAALLLRCVAMALHDAALVPLAVAALSALRNVTHHPEARAALMRTDDVAVLVEALRYVGNGGGGGGDGSGSSVDGGGGGGSDGEGGDGRHCEDARAEMAARVLRNLARGQSRHKLSLVDASAIAPLTAILQSARASRDEQCAALTALAALTWRHPDHRAAFAVSGGIAPLVKLVSTHAQLLTDGVLSADGSEATGLRWRPADTEPDGGIALHNGPLTAALVRGQLRFHRVTFEAFAVKEPLRMDHYVAVVDGTRWKNLGPAFVEQTGRGGEKTLVPRGPPSPSAHKLTQSDGASELISALRSAGTHSGTVTFSRAQWNAIGLGERIVLSTDHYVDTSGATEIGHYFVPVAQHFVPDEPPEPPLPFATSGEYAPPPATLDTLGIGAHARGSRLRCALGLLGNVASEYDLANEIGILGGVAPLVQLVRSKRRGGQARYAACPEVMEAALSALCGVCGTADVQDAIAGYAAADLAEPLVSLLSSVNDDDDQTATPLMRELATLALTRAVTNHEANANAISGESGGAVKPLVVLSEDGNAAEKTKAAHALNTLARASPSARLKILDCKFYGA